ncbi:MAG TPA: ubiquinol-cytochrome c reductase iron-sulfur subunit [Thermomicrobiales bacterium]|nr:ubiquinol-cytochrome c reductase iron-sulfur subunit [Thermomicrobiales bacterium]
MQHRGDDWLINRRRALKWLIRLAYGTFALAFALPALALRALSQQKAQVAVGDPLVYAMYAGGASAGTPLRADEIAVGEGVQAFPLEKSDNQANLIEVVRLAEGDGADALVAYSAICTHLGCVVYAELNEDNNIACPCHDSRFDPEDDAEVISGPANRPLPSLPIAVNDEGIVVVAGPFSGPVGPE